jgi:ankyrin repeat protein
VLRLLELGANPFLANAYGDTPIQVARITNNSPAVRVLLEHLFARALNTDASQGSVGQSIITQCLLEIWDNQTAFYDRLKDLNKLEDDVKKDDVKKDDVKKNGGIEHEWVREFIVLNTHRSFDGDLEIINDSARHANLVSLQFLLLNGVHRPDLANALNRQDRSGHTPLHHFVTGERMRGINLLLRLGADMNIPAADERTAFGTAIFEGSNEMRNVMLFEFLHRLANGHEVGDRIDNTPGSQNAFWRIIHLIDLYFATLPPQEPVQTGSAPFQIDPLSPVTSQIPEIAARFSSLQ